MGKKPAVAAAGNSEAIRIYERMEEERKQKVQAKAEANKPKTLIITGVEVSFGPNEYNFSVPKLGEYPDLFDIVRHRVPNNLWPGAIKRRFSNTQERSYMSNGCVNCNAFIGEFYEHDAWVDQTVIYEFSIRITERWRHAIEAAR